MKISQWQRQQKLSDRELAKLWGYKDRSMVWYIKKGLKTPSPRKAMELVKISKGSLSLEDIYSLSKID